MVKLSHCAPVSARPHDGEADEGTDRKEGPFIGEENFGLDPHWQRDAFVRARALTWSSVRRVRKGAERRTAGAGWTCRIAATIIKAQPAPRGSFQEPMSSSPGQCNTPRRRTGHAGTIDDDPGGSTRGCEGGARTRLHPFRSPSDGPCRAMCATGCVGGKFWARHVPRNANGARTAAGWLSLKAITAHE